jgi:hypothetical protein
MITIHCAIELTLDRIFYRLQEKVFDQRDHNLAQADFVATPTTLARALSSRTASMW